MKTVEERELTLHQAESHLGELAERWIAAIARRDRPAVRKLDTQLDAAQADCRRADRYLRAARKRKERA